MRHRFAQSYFPRSGRHMCNRVRRQWEREQVSIVYNSQRTKCDTQRIRQALGAGIWDISPFASDSGVFPEEGSLAIFESLRKLAF